MLSTTIFAIASRTSGVALPRCGVSTTLAISVSALSIFGSCSNTSRPAPAICLFCSARTSAASSMIGSARGIDKERGLFHQAEFARADLMPRLVVERRMQRDEIGIAQQLIERHINQSGFALLVLRLAPRRPIQYAHAEAMRAARHRLADQSAAADEPDAFCPTRRSPSDGPTGCRGRLACARQPVALDHAPRHREHQSEGQVGGGLGGDRRQ